VAGYSGTASSLFNAPSAGDFSIIDDNFEGRKTAGDPRWR
jgi:hypothetical protein